MLGIFRRINFISFFLETKAEEMCVFGKGGGGRILLRRHESKFCVFRRKEEGEKECEGMYKTKFNYRQFCLSFKVDFVDS